MNMLEIFGTKLKILDICRQGGNYEKTPQRRCFCVVNFLRKIQEGFS